jgi:hypothetical protein
VLPTLSLNTGTININYSELSVSDNAGNQVALTIGTGSKYA